MNSTFSAQLPIISSILDTCPLPWCMHDCDGREIATSDNYPPPNESIYRKWDVPLEGGGIVTWCLRDV
jgi:hypothetical protein